MISGSMSTRVATSGSDRDTSIGMIWSQGSMSARAERERVLVVAVGQRVARSRGKSGVEGTRGMGRGVAVDEGNGSVTGVYVGTRKGRVWLRAERRDEERAGLALREMVIVSKKIDRLQAKFGAYKFPEEISFSTCFSSDRSATSRFSRTFSFSSSFIRRA